MAAQPVRRAALVSKLATDLVIGFDYRLSGKLEDGELASLRLRGWTNS
jgi:hypothetical protein